MKKKKANEKKQKWRKVNKEKELKRQRELYAECLEKKEKKRKNYEDKQHKLAKKEGWKYQPNHEHRKQMKDQVDEKINGD